MHFFFFCIMKPSPDTECCGTYDLNSQLVNHEQIATLNSYFQHWKITFEFVKTTVRDTEIQPGNHRLKRRHDQTPQQSSQNNFLLGNFTVIHKRNPDFANQTGTNLGSNTTCFGWGALLPLQTLPSPTEISFLWQSGMQPVNSGFLLIYCSSECDLIIMYYI